MTPENRNGESICANIGKEYFGRGKGKIVRKKIKIRAAQTSCKL